MTMAGQNPPDPPLTTDDSLMTPPRATAMPVPAGTSAPGGSPRPAQPYAAVGRSRNEGHGKRLTAAFEALEVFPALAESRNRLLSLIA